MTTHMTPAELATASAATGLWTGTDFVPSPTVSLDTKALNAAIAYAIQQARYADQALLPPAPINAPGCIASFQNSTLTGEQVFKDLYTFDVLRGVLFLEDGADTLWQAQAVAGYVRNRNNGFTAGVGVDCLVTAEVPGSASWGYCSILQDFAPVDEYFSKTFPPEGGRTLYHEHDFRITQATTQIVGCILTYDGVVQSSNADGFIAGATPRGGRWLNGFRTYDGQAYTALYAGNSLPAGTANGSSQPIMFAGSNGSGANVLAQISFQAPTNTLVVQSPTGGLMHLAVNNNVTAGGFFTVASGGGLQLGAQSGGTGASSSQPIVLKGRKSDGSLVQVALTMDATGAFVLPGQIDGSGVPTTDPHIVGRLWNNAGSPKFSAG